MKKILFIMVLSIAFCNVNAAVCSPEDEFYNPSNIITYDYTSSNPSAIIYDIASIKMNGNKLEISGWAYNKAVNNNLGNVDDYHGNTNWKTNVYVALGTSTGFKLDENLLFDVEYNRTNYSVKGYNLTYWNCVRMSESAETYPNHCIKSATTYYWGGFRASIDLERVQEYVKARNIDKLSIYMAVDSSLGGYKDKSTLGLNSNINVYNEEKWFKLAIPKAADDGSVSAYKGPNENVKINISGLSSIARIILDYKYTSTEEISQARVIGKNGLYCSSGVTTKKNVSYFKAYTNYNVDTTAPRITTAYRGPSQSEMSQSIYKLKIGNIYKKTYKKMTYYVVPPGNTNGDFYAPASWLYFQGETVIKFDAKEEVPIPKTCDDTVSKTSCDSDSGTKAVFHENDDLKICTLDSSVESGFTLVSASDTTPNSKNSPYCEVACKDDYDIEFPTDKYSVAGRYFTLDNYTPKINIKRTCVTTAIKYSVFEDDFEASRDDMIKKYNTWQDYKTILNQLNSSGAGENPSTTDGSCSSVPPTKCSPTPMKAIDEKNTLIHLAGTGTGGGTGGKSEPKCVPDPGCSGGSYGHNDWKIYGVSGSNLIYDEDEYEGRSGTHYWTNATCCGSTSGTTYSEALSAEKQKYSTMVANAKSAYETAKSKYESIIKSYKMCFSWIDDKKIETKPSLELNTEDYYNNLFSNNNLYSNTNPNSRKTTLTYWRENAETNNTYTSGNYSNTASKKELVDVNCGSLKECKTNSGTKYSYYTNGYVKRVEELSYTYNLPTVYTNLPDGKPYLSTSGLGNYIELYENSVPIWIQTNPGFYEYSIAVKNIIDSNIRGKARNINNDTFTTRFFGSNGVLNNSNEHVCEYQIERDLYNTDNNKLMFFYRPVDLVDLDPNSRALYGNIGYNWDYLNNTKASKVKTKMESAGIDYQVLTSKDKFEFTLSPGDMQAIRAYNKSTDYGNFDMTCSNTDNQNYHCKSKFLTCISDSNAILGNACYNGLYNVKTINYQSLFDNRRTLIDKLDSIGW